MQKRFTYALTAGLLSWAAPAGLLGVRFARKPYDDVSLGRVRSEIAAERASYMGVAATTAVIFGLFGYFLGRKVDALAQLSETDSLTGLLNARGFWPRLSDELKRALRYREPLTLLFLDLDGLKDINDRHGHRAGSLSLRKTAGMIRSELRETDVAARWGGDEFALIAQKTGVEAGMELADRIRRRVAAGMAAWPLTISIGVTAPDLHSTSSLQAKALLRAADLAMYEAKKRGKNSVFRFGPTGQVGQGDNRNGLVDEDRP